MKIKYWVYSLLFVLLSYLIYNRINKDSKLQQTNKVRKEAIVDAYIVKAEPFSQQISLSGVLLANEEVVLHSEQTGIVTGIYFKEGAFVKKGDLLVTINDDELQAKLMKAENMESLAKEQEYRAKKLLEKEAISQDDYDVIKADYKSLQAETMLIKSQVVKSQVRAPFDGRIGFRSISVGEYLTPSIEITKLVNSNPIKLSFSVPEKYATKIGNDPIVYFMLDGVEEHYKAKVYAKEAFINEVSRTIELKAYTNNDKGTLFPGAFATVNLQLNEIKKAKLIPTQSIIPILKGHKVLVIKNGLVQERVIEIGDRTNDRVLVTDGISVGDTVLVTGIMGVKIGSKVVVNIK